MEDAMVEFVPQRMPGCVGLNEASIYAELFAWEDRSVNTPTDGSSISSVMDGGSTGGGNVAGEVTPLTEV